jgi:hypothetical protein
MFEYQNNILCVHGSWLINEGIISEPNYKQLCSRGHLEKLTTGGNGRKALIKFETMRQDIKKKIIELVGDPTERAKHITFADYIKTDTAAVDFYNNYTLDNGEGLPEKNIREYTANAEILNAIDIVYNSTMAKRKALGSKVKAFDKIAEVIQELPKHQWPHSLPANVRRLKDKLKQYKEGGYESLIHKGFCHKNAEKINDDAKFWVLARWSDRINRVVNYAQMLREYNQMAEVKGWKQLKSEQSLQNFLQDPKIEVLWYGHRFGELDSKEKFSYQHSTILASKRDTLWYSDGTKLNYYYQDENGKMQTCQVYEVFDTYSEVFLGYHISKSEDFEAQYHAYKMALQTSGHKPYEIKFDNQGGHKKLENNSFLGRISRICTKTQPYNGKSKTIENAFGRFQQQFLKRDWFFTGQNITSKRKESKANMEFILANVKNLPTLDEVKAIYAERRKEWNSAPHPKTGISRLEMYLNSVNPATPEVSYWEMIDLFWIAREKPVTCTAYGISFKHKGAEYQYMVYGEDRKPDLRWLRDNIDNKFIVKYDPDDMTLIYLYQDTPLGLKRVAAAEPKVQVHRSAQEQEDWEQAFIRDVLEQNKALRLEDYNKMESIAASHGMSTADYGLNNPSLKGINSRRKAQPKKEKTDIGAYQKAVSNAVLTTVDDEADIYSSM